MKKKQPEESPEAFAQRYRESTDAAWEKAAPALVKPALGDAVWALAEAGTPVTNEALIAHLLDLAQRNPTLASACGLAVRKLGWQG